MRDERLVVFPNHVITQHLHTNQPLTEVDLKALETTLGEIAKEHGETG